MHTETKSWTVKISMGRAEKGKYYSDLLNPCRQPPTSRHLLKWGVGGTKNLYLTNLLSPGIWFVAAEHIFKYHCPAGNSFHIFYNWGKCKAQKDTLALSRSSLESGYTTWMGDLIPEILNYLLWEGQCPAKKFTVRSEQDKRHKVLRKWLVYSEYSTLQLLFWGSRWVVR